MGKVHNEDLCNSLESGYTLEERWKSALSHSLSQLHDSAQRGAQELFFGMCLRHMGCKNMYRCEDSPGHHVALCADLLITIILQVFDHLRPDLFPADISAVFQTRTQPQNRTRIRCRGQANRTLSLVLCPFSYRHLCHTWNNMPIVPMTESVRYLAVLTLISACSVFGYIADSSCADRHTFANLRML
jgi:hypothetical protein